jgi:hypothetical protein
MQKLLAVAATFAASANALNIMKQTEADILAEADIFEHGNDVVYDLAKDRPHH